MKKLIILGVALLCAGCANDYRHTSSVGVGGNRDYTNTSFQGGGANQDL